MNHKESHWHDDMGRMLSYEGKILIPRDLAVFEGHFPGKPLVPGVYSLDLAFRLVQKKLGRPIRLKEIIHAKFLRPLVPESEALYEVLLGPENQTEQNANVLLTDPISQEPFVKVSLLIEFLA